MIPTHPLERLWPLVVAGDADAVAALLAPDATWDDPLFDGAAGAAVRAEAIPRLAAWASGRAASPDVQHLNTTADARRVVVEDVLHLRDGVIWNPMAQQAEKAAEIYLPVAAVADRGEGGTYRAVRVYFSTWAVLDGASRARIGPICPDERAAAGAAMDAMPTVRTYFDRLAIGDAGMVELFEPDGYFREPANNYATGRDQLMAHFSHILALGGVGIEFLTATRQDQRIGLELQTVVWGPKRMAAPQAGFACYELGPNGKMRGSRVYDSVVPP